MSKRDRKLKKKKRREERLRQQRHAQRFADGWREPRDASAEGIEGDDTEGVAANGPPRFATFGMERSQRQVAKLTAGKGFKDAEEYSAFLGQHIMSSPVPNSLAGSDDPKERAQEFAFQALETEDPSATRQLAQQALDLDPDCVDALAALAHLNAKSQQDESAALEQAVAVGERVLGGKEFFEQNKGRFWGMVLTRPYMRARDLLGRALVASGRIPDAIPHYEALLELNPNDNQGNRCNLLGCYLHEANLAGLARLFAQFKDEDSAFFNWGRVLERFIAGDRIGAARALSKARQQNQHVQGFLLGKLDPPKHLGYYEPGAKSEAAEVLVSQGLAWYKHKEVLDWLAAGGPAVTEEEAKQSVASYPPPLAALVRLGQPGDPWPDYESMGLHAEHVPELIRMATDACLRASGDDAVYFAPVHAWRALAQLRAEAAIEPLVCELRNCEGDDWAQEEIPACLGRIGPAALQALAAFLADAGNSLYPRATAAEGIVEVATAHQEKRDDCVQLLLAQLQRYEENSAELNAHVIANLISLKAAEALPVIEQAFDADEVDEGIVGDIDSVRKDIGA